MQLADMPIVTDQPLFAGVPNDELAALLVGARLVRMDKGATVFNQGAPALTFFLLLAGRIKVVQTNREGQQIVAHLVPPGEVFGLAHALGQENYPGTAVAIAACTMLGWPQNSWDSMAARHTGVAAAVLQMIGRRTHAAYARLRGVAGEHVEQRIAQTLLRVAQQSGRRTDSGTEIGFPLTRRDIAELTSTTLYTVSRTLSGWERAGIVSGGRQCLLILDTTALDKIAQGA